MAPKIGPSSPNVPTTDPLWTDQRLVDGKELTPEELKITKEQTNELNKLHTALQQPVQKGDWKGARARVDTLEKQFEGLSSENKKYMYDKLQTKNGTSEAFHYRLSTESRDKLLKKLNPEHSEDHIQKYTINDAKEKAQKNLELNMQGTSKQQELEKVMEEQNKINKEVIQNTIR
ncbi:hypothetical protein L0244_18435 [bacterium]|nr:hypothetical protein [bacterium]